MTDIDPTETLAQLRSTAYIVSETSTDNPLVNRLVEDFTDLDDYLTDGGDLPDQWRRAIGRPRLEQEGRVLDHIPPERHGKPSTYNLGCRCFRCRKANRERALRYRQQKERSS